MHDHLALPSVLVSYVTLKKFLKERRHGGYRSWVLDSGAYSALTSGVRIDLHEFTDTVLSLLVGEDPPEEVFALDVIGDPEASLRNAEYMVAQGISAIPTFHYGESWNYLSGIGQYPKVAVGGLVGRGANGHGGSLHWGKRLRFLNGCFGRLWPKWVHGFGCCDRRLLKTLPFASVDSTTWYYGVGRYGAVQLGSRYHDSRISKVVRPRGENPRAFDAAIRLQAMWHLELEQDIRGKFGHVLSAVNIDPFSIRLGVTGSELEYLTSNAKATR